MCYEKPVPTCTNVVEGVLTHIHQHCVQVLNKTRHSFLLVVRESSVKPTGIICQENSAVVWV